MKSAGVKIVNNSQTELFQTILEVPDAKARKERYARELIAGHKKVKIALVLTVSWSVCHCNGDCQPSFVPIATSHTLSVAGWQTGSL